MNSQKQIDCDVLVIGSGIAGMAAAARASALGLKTVQTGSPASFFLASGLIDLLGVYPLEKQQVLKNPETGIKRLIADLPGHPYSKTGYTALLESLAFINGFLSEAGLAYQDGNRKNQFVLTAAGTFKPSFLVPKTVLNGCAENIRNKQVLFVDFKGLKGYSARQVANVVHQVCPAAKTLTIEIPGHCGDLTPIQVANLFETDPFISTMTKMVQEKIEHADLVGFPAVCGIHNSLTILGQIEGLIGCPCFEIPGLPPSIPGMRLKNAFEKQLSENDVMVLNNARVKFNSFRNQTFFMTAVNQSMETPVKAKGVILATGRFQGDGLHAKRGLIRETVFDLPVHQPQQRSLWHDRDFFYSQGHAVNQAGIETTALFQPVDKSGRPMFEHLYAAGSILAHNDWTRLKSGAGVSCVSAVSAVDHLYTALKGGQ